MNRYHLSDYEKILLESIANGGQFVFYPSGVSMLPTIIGGEDCVVLVEASDLKRHDLVLYKRKNGQFVLHRIIGIKDGEYTMCGDNQVYLEHGIVRSQILAKVCEIRKKDGSITAAKDLEKKFILISAKRFYKRVIGKIKRIIKGVF